MTFPPRLFWGAVERFVARHFWFDFTPAACFTLAGLPLLLFGAGFGLYHWMASVTQGQPATAGTVMLAALPFLTGFQLLLQAVGVDISVHLNNRVSPSSEAGDC